MLKYVVVMKSSHKLKFQTSKCIHSIKQLFINIKLEFYVNQKRFKYLKSILCFHRTTPVSLFPFLNSKFKETVVQHFHCILHAVTSDSSSSASSACDDDSKE